jgi:adenylate cyclase
VQTQYLGTEAGESLNNNIIPETTAYFLHLNNLNFSEYKGKFKGKEGTILVDIYAFKDIPGFDLKDHPLDWYLILAIPKDDFVGRIEENFRTSIILTVVFAVIGVLMSVLISVFITQPLTTLKNNMNSVATLDIMAEKQTLTQKHSPRFLLPLQEIQSMKTSFERMRNGIVSFGKFVPVDYVKYLLQSNKEAHRSLVFTQVTVLFMDIVGFTSMSEKMAPKNLQNVLGKFFDEMSTIILQNEGTIDKYIGDCIMAVWNAPRLVDNHTSKAVWAAIKCIEQLDKARAKFESIGAPNFRVRIGVHTGAALVGNVGSKQRLNFTVLGDTVNVASRLESLNKKLKLQGILVSAEVQKAVCKDKHLIMEDQGEHEIDGRQAPIHVYCLKPQESLDSKNGTRPTVNTAVMEF